MKDKEKISTLIQTLTELTKRFGAMDYNLDRVLAVQMGASTGTPTTKKDVMVPAYWKADGKHIWDQGGYCWIQDYCVKMAHNSTM